MFTDLRSHEEMVSALKDAGYDEEITVFLYAINSFSGYFGKLPRAIEVQVAIYSSGVLKIRIPEHRIDKGWGSEDEAKIAEIIEIFAKVMGKSPACRFIVPGYFHWMYVWDYPSGVEEYKDMHFFQKLP